MSSEPAAFAAALAPELDRIRIAISRAAPTHLGPLASELGVSQNAMSVLAMLRNLPPDRSASRQALHSGVFVYQPLEATTQALNELVAAELITATSDNVVLATRGVTAVDSILGATAQIVEETWRDVDLDFASLHAISSRAVAAAGTTGGRAYSVMAPIYDPPGLPIATRFAESLTPLRFHRFDAHIAAWQGAGLTVEQVQVLEDGPQKDQIEASTNVLAAAPYALLTAEERAELLDGLRKLP